MKEYTVAILGATGAVGQEMRKRLEERNFPVGRLKLLASTRSAGKTVMFRGQNIPIEEANEAAFQGVDLVLGAAENEVAIRFAPAIRAAGAVFVDNSSAFRMDPTVPLVGRKPATSWTSKKIGGASGPIAPEPGFWICAATPAVFPSMPPCMGPHLWKRWMCPGRHWTCCPETLPATAWRRRLLPSAPMFSTW